MKKIYALFAIIMSFPFVSNSQTSFGVNGGAVLGSFKVVYDDGIFGSTTTFRSRTGFSFGVLTDIAVSDGFSIRPGLSFIQKGGEEEESGVDYIFSLNYAEASLDILYKVGAGAGKFFIGVFPTAAIGFSGKIKEKDGSTTISEDVKFGTGDEDDLKPLDLGGGILAGFEFGNGLFLQLNFNMSLTNISNDDEFTWKNKYFGIKLGYLFSRKSVKKE